MPIGCAGNTARGIVRLSMARCTLQACRPIVMGSARDGRHMDAPLYALLGAVAFGVTVQAARVSQHLMDLQIQALAFELCFCRHSLSRCLSGGWFGKQY